VKQDIFIPNHLHLILRGYINKPPKTVEETNEFLSQLVTKVRMKVVAGPTSVYVSDPGNEGVTGTVTLATSHASIHVWDFQRPSLFQFDLYSCSQFTSFEVLELINEKFGLISCNYIVIDRNSDDFKEIERGQIF
jgi:S-adenosylmethionine/arginine decarboxylase-like enzyme